MKAYPRKRVKVYFNLHKKLFSVVSLEGEDKGLVVDHARSINLFDCKLVVQPAGNKRVREEMKKNVHAYIAGYAINDRDMDTYIEQSNESLFVSDVTYNPYRHDSFVMRSESLPGNEFPINKAKACRFELSINGKPDVVAYGGELI